MSRPLQGERESALGFCWRVLPSVSRTFALTIPVLPEPVRDEVCVAYLVCRIADTVEDDEQLSSAFRGAAFDALLEALQTPSQVALSGLFGRWPGAPLGAHTELMGDAERVLTAFATLRPVAREAIAACAREMISGMSASRASAQVVAGVSFTSQDLASLEGYCHFVAGTVGHLLTTLFADFSPGFATESRREQGRRFGLGLQLVNVLKDRREDRQRGASFLPAAWLDADGELQRSELTRLAERILAHLERAGAFTLALPADPPGLRLFCLWALWMAAATLREIGRDSEPQPRIPRTEVASLIGEARRLVADDSALAERFARLCTEARVCCAA